MVSREKAGQTGKRAGTSQYADNDGLISFRQIIVNSSLFDSQNHDFADRYAVQAILPAKPGVNQKRGVRKSGREVMKTGFALSPCA
jgi:hypothetical protein